MRRILILSILVIILISGGFLSKGLNLDLTNLGKYFPLKTNSFVQTPSEKTKIVSEESVITDVVERVSSSVVTVSIVKARNIGSIFEVDPFDPWGSMRQQPQSPQNTQTDIGTGFIVGADGLIVTNKHVVGDTSAKYKVVTKDDKTYEVGKIFRDPTNDIAIIKIEANNLVPVTLGDSSKLKVGQMAIAIGTALGEFRNTVSVGVISGLSRTITATGGDFSERLQGVIQTDAAINQGNSGGPLLNLRGQVVGINTAIASGAQSIGFALPINLAKRDIQSVRATGEIQAPFLGVRYLILTPEIAKQQKLPVDYGALVRGSDEGPAVEPGSTAAAAGLEAEDIILEVSGQKIDKDRTLVEAISKFGVGDEVELMVNRGGKKITLTATLVKRPN